MTNGTGLEIRLEVLILEWFVSGNGMSEILHDQDIMSNLQPGFVVKRQHFWRNERSLVININNYCREWTMARDVQIIVFLKLLLL